MNTEVKIYNDIGVPNEQPTMEIKTNFLNKGTFQLQDNTETLLCVGVFQMKHYE